ncbi:MAG TPA: hypothetical protein VNG33_10750 [Polyangiaceae bacterium]|nr:hypothetical protein [Polyangiaceae bacterium]
MTNFANRAERWANELWNVSLLPTPIPANVANETELTLGRLENIDERRSLEAFPIRLRVRHDRSSVILV